MYSVISLIVDSLPGNTKNRESTRSWTARVRLVHSWTARSIGTNDLNFQKKNIKAWSGYLSRTRLKCSFTVVKPPWSCIVPGNEAAIWAARQHWACCSFVALVQLVRSPSRNTKLSHGTPGTCTKCFFESFVFWEGDLTSWTVARKLQQAQCWGAAQIAASISYFWLPPSRVSCMLLCPSLLLLLLLCCILLLLVDLS